MKSLSQSEYGELRSLYQQVYAPKFETILDEMTDQEVNELTEEIIEETVEEFFLECLEEGLDIGSVEETLCESLETSLMMLNEVSDSYYADAVKSGKAKAAKAKRAEMIGKVKGAVKKVGSALKAGAGKAAGAARAGAGAAYKGASRAAGAAVGAVKKAGSVAKSEFKKGYDSASKSSSSDSGSSDSGSSSPSSSSSSSGSSSSGSTRRAVGGAVRKVGSLLKKGLKKAVGGAARAVEKGAGKVARRMGEEVENVDEVYRGKHGQSDKEYADSRSPGGKMVSGDSKQSGAEYTHGRRVKAANPGMQPDVGGKTKPKSQGKMDRGTRADLEYRKANLKKEELEATGLFTTKEIESILEAEINEGSYEDRIAANNKRYDANRKRAAQRAAARNAARDAGQTGAVKGVGYVTPRREKETYTDSAGKTRHAKGL